jgi:hypothetical protein
MLVLHTPAHPLKFRSDQQRFLRRLDVNLPFHYQRRRTRPHQISTPCLVRGSQDIVLVVAGFYLHCDRGQSSVVVDVLPDWGHRPSSFRIDTFARSRHIRSLDTTLRHRHRLSVIASSTLMTPGVSQPRCLGPPSSPATQ